MSFSIFNKKGNEPPKPASTERPRPGSPRAPAHSAPEPGTLAYPGGRGSAGATGAAAKPAKPIVEHGFQGGAKPRPAQLSGAPAAQAERSGPNSVMTMELQESPYEAAPALEEAAILYANRQDAAAQGALEEAILADDIPPQAARQAWLMLFDLLENQGRRADFDTAAIKYAVRFETSPPNFSDRSTAKEAGRQGGGAQVVFAGPLGAASAKQFDQLRSLAAKHRTLTLDFSKVDDLGREGCVELRASLAALRKSGHALTLVGAERLIAILLAKVEVGRAEVPETFWLLLLDLYQACDMQADFEEKALDYCITYEVSPPSWTDVPRKAAPPAAQGAADAAAAPQDAFYIRGEVEGSGAAALKGLAEHAAERDAVVIDVYHLKRMDFIAAGSLLNLVAALKAAGKEVEIRSPSPLLATLFVTMGFTSYAKLARRKA